MKTSALLVTLAILGAGLGSITLASAMSSKPGNAPSVAGDRYRCFDSDFIHGFQTDGDQKVIITSDQNQAYELTLGGACIGIDTSFMIGVRPRMGSTEICGPFDADILYNDNGGLHPHQECPITNVRHLQGDEAAPYVSTPRGGASSSSSR